MSSLDICTQKLNDILPPSCNIKDNLSTAIRNYCVKIERLKSIVFFPDKCEIKQIYDSSNDIFFRIEKLLKMNFDQRKTWDKSFEEFSDIHKCIKPLIESGINLEKRLDFFELRDNLLSYESDVLASRALSDKMLLSESLKQYFDFVYMHLKENNGTNEVHISEMSRCHENSIDSLMFLMKEFELLLQTLNFPITIFDVLEETDNQTWCDDDLQSFSNEFKLLMSFNVSHINVIIAKPLPDTICLPMQVILNPLEKRFRYHFYGTRKTNCLDKPEWYMTQILQWIRKNDYFLTVVWRDFVSDCHKPVCNLKLEFMRGLVTLLLDKLEYDLGLSNSQTMRFNSQLEMKCSASERMNRTDDFLNNCELLTNVEYFSHLIDVVLQTDAKLTQLGYPFDEPRPSDALIHPKVFSCWLLLEQNLASDRLKDLLAKSASWSIVDETQKRVQCVDDFMALIRALNLRGHQLSDKISRSRFLQIQLNLIIEFFNHLTSLARNESSIHIGSDLQKNESNFPIKNKKTDIARLFGIHRNSLLSLNNEADMFGQSMIGQLFNSFIDGFGRRCSSYWITVLNTLKHLFDIMLEWANDQCYITFWEESVTRNLLQIGDPWLIDIGLTSARKPCNSRFAGDNNDSELHGGVFNEALSLYKQKIDEMLKETVKFTFDDLKIKSTVYINDHDHWTRPSLGGHQYLGSRNTELANLTVSTTGSILYVSLRDWLFNYSKTLHPKLFTRIWQSIAKGLDDFLYRNLILSNRFSLLGAAQLRFDLSHCLYPMFAFYSDRPEIYFSQSRDSYVLLNLLRGSAELLKETLIESLKSDTRSESNPLGPLLELGVYNLTPEEALKIIALRIV